MGQDRIGVGIIGLNPTRGWAAGAHVGALGSLRDYDIRALSTTRQESADAAAAAFGVPYAFDNYHALVEHPEVDLVVITVKVPDHFELVSAALDAGKMVYCEWPLGRNLAETEALAAHARKAGVRTAIGLQSRAAPEVVYLRELVRQGYVGEVVSTSILGTGMLWAGAVDEANAFTAERSNGVNMLTILCAHTVDAMCWSLGEFAHLHANIGNRRHSTRVIETGEVIPMTSPDQIVFGGMLEGGIAAGVQYRSGISRIGQLNWEVHGTEGELRIVAESGHVGMLGRTLWGGRGDDQTVSQITVPPEFHGLAPEAPSGLSYNVAQTYANFAHDLREGTKFCPGFEDSVLRHRMLDAVERSSQTRQFTTYR
jgi:predicted dehydrogenase